MALLEDDAVDGRENVEVFGDLEEAIGPRMPSRRMIPAHQRLDPDDVEGAAHRTAADSRE